MKEQDRDIKMNRKLATVLMAAMLLSCCIANATIKIDWSSDGGPTVDLIQDVTTNDLPIGSIVQLIWTPTNLPAYINDPVSLLNWTNPAFGQVMLDMTWTTNSIMGGVDGLWSLGARVFDATNFFLAEDAFLPGYVYQRVFDVAWGNTPTAGDFYGVSVISTNTIPGGPLTDQDGAPQPPNISYLNWEGQYLVNQIVAVPEPGTLTLFGLGLVLVALRRKLRRRS